MGLPAPNTVDNGRSGPGKQASNDVLVQSDVRTSRAKREKTEQQNNGSATNKKEVDAKAMCATFAFFAAPATKVAFSNCRPDARGKDTGKVKRQDLPGSQKS